MLQPSRMKWRKPSKGRMGGLAHRGSTLAFGDFGLQATENGRITQRQIEAGRIAISRHVKRGGKLWIRIFPDKGIVKKPAETRMGHGKGAVEYYVAVVAPGRVIYEIEGVGEDVAREAFRLAGHKLNVTTRVVSRHDTF